MNINSNPIKNVNFSGKLYVDPREYKNVSGALDELDQVLTPAQKDEFINEVKKIKAEAQRRDIEVGIDGCSSDNPHGAGELRIAFRRTDGGYENTQAWLVPGSHNIFGVRNETEISKIADDFIGGIVDYPKKEEKTDSGLKDHLYSIIA